MSSQTRKKLTDKLNLVINDLSEQIRRIQIETEETCQRHAKKWLELSKTCGQCDCNIGMKFKIWFKIDMYRDMRCMTLFLWWLKNKKLEDEGKSGQHSYYMIGCKRIHLPQEKSTDGYISQHDGERIRI